MTRQVIVSHLVDKLVQGQPFPSPRYVREEKGQATFHQFGCAYDEFESGAGNYSTAIVEWPDGNVECVRADFIRFCDPLGKEQTK
jgi:hypothetical protein